MSSKFVKKIHFTWIKYWNIPYCSCSHNNNPTHFRRHTRCQGNVFSILLCGHMTTLHGQYLVQEYPTKHFVPKPHHWYRQHLLGLWWHSYLCRYTAMSQVSVIISNIKNPWIVPFVFSGQSPDQRCQGNFWNSEDPSKTVTWAFWFSELSFCKLHAPKKNMKENDHFFMHVQGLSVDCFSAPPLSLSALWQEPQIWKGLYSDPSPISKQLCF
jgi:hypothetical protein